MIEPPEPSAALDCRACGACCRDVGNVVLVSAADLVRWRREGQTKILDGLVEGHFSQLAFPTTTAGACVHQGTPGHPNDCSIYETRSESCRVVLAGSRECLTYRRIAGLDAR
jgi:Fe-S-cluster containining protein